MNLYFPLLLLILSFGCSQRRTVNEDLSKPLATHEFVDYLTTAHNYLTEQQELCQRVYGLGAFERWFYDQETGQIEFFNGDTLKLRIKYQEVGSVSKTSNTWLWAWDNPHILENIKTESEKVREFGEQQKFWRLTKRKWEADEVDGWEMTAIMAYLIKAKGAYRIPTENVFSFVVFTDIERINSSK